ncbi:MAG: cytochrome c-type biogenesis protein CcmH [Oceanospirillaceae bacterium]|nr:cytochrome c-type biogenesis protein CcmH [Oceanospirillaceae bacterium]|tara:strand:+ start:172 stop:639 length:468 start_codon:yes stop_codon:yes gene_type:complete
MKQMLLLMLFLSAPALAVVGGYQYEFDNPEDEARFQQLAEDLRCPKCQNQNLADSNAPVAIDLRNKVYELMQDGQSDDEIVDYLVARYGDFVRYKPPFRADTLLLWGGPLLLLLAGILLMANLRRQQKVPVSNLTDAEKAHLEALKKGLQKDSDS